MGAATVEAEAKPKPEPPVPQHTAEQEPPAKKDETADERPLDPARFNGTYSGPICYGETKKEPQHCYHAQGRIEDAIISGEWVMGPAKKIRATMAGRVLRSGGVRIQIETRNADDDSRLATITLAGTVKGGLIDAAGSFRNGRPATLSWHKNPPAAR